MTPAGALTTQYSFSCSDDVCPDGANPYAGLVQAGNGRFYGMTGDGHHITSIKLNGSATSLCAGKGNCEVTVLYRTP